MTPKQEAGGPKRASPGKLKNLKEAAGRLPEADRKAAWPLLWTAANRRPGRPEAERMKRLATIAAIKGNSDPGEPSGNSVKKEGKK